MTIDTNVDHDRRVVTLTLTGTLSNEGLLGVAEVLKNTPGVDRGFGVLLDLRLSNGRAITSEGVRTMATYRHAVPLSSRRAIVVPPGLGYGMARMYQILRGDQAPKVFTDVDKAQRWVEGGPA